LPQNWHYRSNKLTYAFNANGHRCKNIEDLDLDNYILFAGCSHTVGIGLELEKTFAYQVASSLKVDYYNLALSGTGIDVMTYNLIMWSNTVKKMPKFLVILWPATVRFSTLHNNLLNPIVPSSASSNANVKNFVGAGINLGFFDTVKTLNTNLIDVAYNEVKIINLANLPKVDLARDLLHSGNESNKIITNEVLSYIE
jgi:hypothetical protein